MTGQQGISSPVSLLTGLLTGLFSHLRPGGMYSPWMTTMSSGHDVSEYELVASGLQRAW